MYAKGLLLFTEVGKYLKKIESRFPGSDRALNSLSKAFADMVDVLRRERSEFEVSLSHDCV